MVDLLRLALEYVVEPRTCAAEHESSQHENLYLFKRRRVHIRYYIYD